MRVMVTNDRSALAVSITATGSGDSWAKNFPTAASQALAARETSSKCPTRVGAPALTSPASAPGLVAGFAGPRYDLRRPSSRDRSSSLNRHNPGATARSFGASIATTPINASRPMGFSTWSWNPALRTLARCSGPV